MGARRLPGSIVAGQPSGRIRRWVAFFSVLAALGPAWLPGVGPPLRIASTNPGEASGLVAGVAPLAGLGAFPGALQADPAAHTPLLCILDTGVDPNHVDIGAERVVAWRDFLTARAQPFDDNGHGTHIAATAAGKGIAGAPGPAPTARLAIGRVMDAQGHGTTEAAIEGVRWCAQLGADAINLSLEEDDCHADGGLGDAVRAAVQAGTLLVTTAGNRGSAACAIHAPGSLPQAFTVGALDGPTLAATGIASFSGRGDGLAAIKPDVVAPGVRIRAASAGTRDGLRTMDGTSMAAPFVTGVVGALRAAHPSATPAMLAEALRATARDGGLPGPDPSWGWGVVNPTGAMAWLDARDPATALRAPVPALP
jgi:serine protease AprX